MKVYQSILAITGITLLALPGVGKAQPWPMAQPITREERVITAPDAIVVGLQTEVQSQWLQDLNKAQAGGKYRTLLRQVALPDDARQYGPFRDYGDFHGVTWQGIADPTPGYWVYAQPYWYVWRDLTTAPKLDRRWGEEQATGKPNTEDLGDIPTAWASATPDGQAEWLLLEYDAPLQPTGVKTYESFNPGAISRITAFTLGGQEVELWKGTDPTRGLENVSIFTLQLKANFLTNRVKLYIDSPAVPGWNEIDAVGLVDTNKKVHWATAASASSTYSATLPQPQTPPEKPGRNSAPQVELDLLDGATLEQRIERLENEVRKLKEALKVNGQPEGKLPLIITEPNDGAVLQIAPRAALSEEQRVQHLEAEVARLKAEVAQQRSQFLRVALDYLLASLNSPIYGPQSANSINSG